MISIYNYTQPVFYLRDYFAFKKDTDPGFSLSKWFKEAGFKSTQVIIEILKGEKDFKPRFAASIVSKIGLDPTDYVYFLALTSLVDSGDEQLKKMYELMLMDLKPMAQTPFSETRFSDGHLFSHWILTTILGATKLKNIELTAKNLKLILREEISEEIIETGLKFLIDEGLLVSEGPRLVKAYDQVSTVTDRKHPNVDHYFMQMADMAKKAVDVPLDLREFQSFNMPMAKEKIPLAKEIIRKCRANLSALCGEQADEVYQMNMFLFPLTDRSLENTSIGEHLT